MKKILSAALLIFLLLTAFSCGTAETAAPSATDAPSGDAAVTAEETTTVDPATVPDMPSDLDYDGRSFTILYPNWGLYNTKLFAEELTGDVMSDALYNRNADVENALNIDVEYYCPGYIDKITPSLTAAAAAGDGSYDLALTHCINGLLSNVSSNVIADWNTIDTVDLAKSYWNKSAIRNFAIDGKLPYAAGDFLLPDADIFIFNTGMIADFGLDDPYDLVRSGAWTWEKLKTMAEVVGADLNGDGQITPEEDRFGFACYNYFKSETRMQTSCGVTFISKDDGEVAIGMDVERITRAAELLDSIEQMDAVHGWAYSDDYDPGKGGRPPVGMETGRVLFLSYAINFVENYRSSDVDFGLLPLPKLDESQENYRILNESGLMCIPSCAADRDLCGYAAELFNYYASVETIPVFYDIVLGEKLTRDADSKEMLDVIFDSTVFELGWNYSLNISSFSTNKGDFASYYEKNLNTWNKTVSSIADAYDSFGA